MVTNRCKQLVNFVSVTLRRNNDDLEPIYERDYYPIVVMLFFYVFDVFLYPIFTNIQIHWDIDLVRGTMN